MFGFVHVIIDVPTEGAATATAFWSQALGWPAGEPWADHPEFRSLEPPDGDAYVHVQSGDHGPRVHLDLAATDRGAMAQRLESLGARVEGRPAEWQTLTSPGGLPLCVVPARPGVAPPPWTGPDGSRVRLVQVCVDVPRHWVETETTFWRTASRWRWVASEHPAFLGKLYPDGVSPVQLLLQRLGDSDSSEQTRVHLDLGSDDIESTARRLVDLGAVRRGTGDGWVVLTDPLGLEFCVTGNPPT